MGKVFRFISKSERERIRLMREAARYTMALSRRLLSSMSSGTMARHASGANDHRSDEILS
jgi:hypothetical protein